MLYLIISLVVLGIISALLGILSHRNGPESPIQEGVSCNTCNGDNAKCEQECLMEASVKEIEYFDDEELDRFRGRESHDYTPGSRRILRNPLYHASRGSGSLEQKPHSPGHQPSRHAEGRSHSIYTGKPRSLMNILEYTFFQNALAGAFLASILCGFIGTYIVTRRLVFISGGITHASFGGIGIGVFAGINPILSAMIFAILSAFGVQWTSSRKDIRQDSAIAMFWTLGMSVGIICCFLTPGFMPDLPSFLFGSILTIGTGDLWLLGILTAFVCILFTLFLRPIQSVAFDRTFSLSQHLPVALIEYMMMALIAMTIVATLKMVGIVLAISLLTIPQMTASIFTYSYRRLIRYSIIVGWFDCLIGLLVSYQFNVPSGATIIFVSILTFALCKTIKAGISQFYKK